MNILDYLDWRGDLSFSLSPFNEVDNLIFSTLAYLKLDGIVGFSDRKKHTLKSVLCAYLDAGVDQSHLSNDPLPLLQKCAQSRRYDNVRVRWYENQVDEARQIQFAAVTFLTDAFACVAFRGTDNTLVGWREDCNFSFLAHTPGQREAAKYLDRVAQKTALPIIVCGHSKGGNFAVYAAAFCASAVQEARILAVYSNDGPGFNSEIAESREYRSILKKTEKIIPDSSLVGILLSSKVRRRVIQSSAKGMMQHNPYTWEVLGCRFVEADERTSTSVVLDHALAKWTDSMSNADKQLLVNSIFDALEETGMHTFHEISTQKWTAYNAIIKAVAKIAPEDRSELVALLRRLFSAGKDALKDETDKRLEKLQRETKRKEPTEKV